ncbi:hypothetical protein Taro_034862 [Colocasia esculenta]|uniref:Uncharacterized protein n=1 Tax=Colocasia esculenta TaxID=4460 RepID=A0A843WGT4_COLES|nr:hypothetical protein [Colocasia esculenta]
MVLSGDVSDPRWLSRDQNFPPSIILFSRAIPRHLQRRRRVPAPAASAPAALYVARPEGPAARYWIRFHVHHSVFSQGEPEYDASPECFALEDLWLHAGSSLEGSSKILARAVRNGACSAFCHPEHKITKHNTQNAIDLVKCEQRSCSGSSTSSRGDVSPCQGAASVCRMTMGHDGPRGLRWLEMATTLAPHALELAWELGRLRAEA